MEQLVLNAGKFPRTLECPKGRDTPRETIRFIIYSGPPGSGKTREAQAEFNAAISEGKCAMLDDDLIDNSVYDYITSIVHTIPWGVEHYYITTMFGIGNSVHLPTVGEPEWTESCEHVRVSFVVNRTDF